MSQRTSGFERQAGDQYMTPEWAVRSLLAVVDLRGDAWACWRLGVQMKRNAGLREGRYQPVNDDERKIADEARK